MLNVHSIMVASQKPRVMAEFYTKVFIHPADMVEEGVEYGWKMGDAYFVVAKHSTIEGTSKEPARIMFNFATEQVKEEFERIKTAGAIVIQEPYEMAGMWVATFADPDGNYFQLMTPLMDLPGR